MREALDALQFVTTDDIKVENKVGTVKCTVKKADYDKAKMIEAVKGAGFEVSKVEEAA